MTDTLPAPQMAEQRYRSTIEEYKKRLVSDPTCTLKSFCREKHTDYEHLRRWSERHGLNVRNLKAEINNPISVEEAKQSFVQFVAPHRVYDGAPLKGISITFSDGVNLSLQEASVENVISLLTIYQSRQKGGTALCSD